ncbi:hypothetical protein AP20H10_07240 [Apilactobacillus apinorum]|uniref:Transposase n=1 Tax=Apilactobacillus apinorum TaxID=1218495 RepID=A0ABP9ZHU2_9LACO
MINNKRSNKNINIIKTIQPTTSFLGSTNHLYNIMIEITNIIAKKIFTPPISMLFMLMAEKYGFKINTKSAVMAKA